MKQPGKKISKGVPAYVVAIAAVAGSLITLTGFIFFNGYHKSENEKVGLVAPPGTNSTTTILSDCSFKIERLNGYKLIRPLLFVNNDCEADDLSGLKENVLSEIDNAVQKGKINTASVYIRDLNSAKWTEVNGDEIYVPGSLIKLVTLIAILKKTEADPSLLNKKFKVSINQNVPIQTFNSKSVEDGKVYSLKELLLYMIAYSDNNATTALHSAITPQDIAFTFSSLGLKPPPPGKLDYAISAMDYSKFFRVLYNTGYLTNDNSEFAMSLLTQCDFKDGLVKKLPDNILVAHKFGESFNNNIRMLGEAGVVYIKNKPYLAIIFTKGTDVEKQASVIADVSKVIFDGMNI